jgi:hypothetical protein
MDKIFILISKNLQALSGYHFMEEYKKIAKKTLSRLRYEY